MARSGHAQGVDIPYRQVRADYSDTELTVYQAYSDEIARAALAAGTFVAPFKRERMTWIKPSFLWCMYRSGWASKPDQERVLAIRITRTGFEEALARSCLSHFEAEVYESEAAWAARRDATPVRIQWDPERDLDLQPLPYRSLQIGLGGETVREYVEEWITEIEDVTELAHEVRESKHAARLPTERPYPPPEDLARSIGATLRHGGSHGTG